MTELQKKIERANDNLALASDPNDFAAISQRIAEWRTQVEKLRVRLQSQLTQASEDSDVVAALHNLTKYRDALHEAEPVDLALWVPHVVKRITLGRRDDPNRSKMEAKWLGEIEFQPDVYSGGPIALSHEHLGVLPAWRAVASWVNEQGRPVTADEVAVEFGIGTFTASYHMREGVLAGLLLKNGRRGGWKPAT